MWAATWVAAGLLIGFVMATGGAGLLDHAILACVCAVLLAAYLFSRAVRLRRSAGIQTITVSHDEITLPANSYLDRRFDEPGISERMATARDVCRAATTDGGQRRQFGTGN